MLWGGGQRSILAFMSRPAAAQAAPSQPAPPPAAPPAAQAAAPHEDSNPGGWVLQGLRGMAWKSGMPAGRQAGAADRAPKLTLAAPCLPQATSARPSSAAPTAGAAWAAQALRLLLRRQLGPPPGPPGAPAPVPRVGAARGWAGGVRCPLASPACCWLQRPCHAGKRAGTCCSATRVPFLLLLQRRAARDLDMRPRRGAAASTCGLPAAAAAAALDPFRYSVLVISTCKNPVCISSPSPCA